VGVFYTQRGNKLNFYNEAGGQEKDFAHPTKILFMEQRPDVNWSYVR